MRRLVALTGLLGGLALAPGATASLKPCPDFDYHGQHARGIREQNVGCHFAEGIVRHVVDHGTSGYSHYSCSRSFLPKNVTEWSCKTTRHGETYGVQFGLQPFI